MPQNVNHRCYDLEQTVFFPLTGNPVGFHHLLLAEWVLCQFPKLAQVVFILSNGKHPDPTKEQAIADKNIRAKILQVAIESFGLPEKSYVAQILPAQQHTLKLSAKTASISTAEFEYKASVPLYDHVLALWKNKKTSSLTHPIQLVIGGDLVRRMSNPQIFSDLHLQALASYCKFLVAPREQSGIQEVVRTLEDERRIAFTYQEIDLVALPKLVHPFLSLSSTLIRQTVQAQHALTCFLPKPAAQIIQKRQLYQVNPCAETINEWDQACQKQEKQLAQTSGQIKKALDQRFEQGLPHTLAFVETSTGGRLTAALAALPGISKHFKESAILYDQSSKEHLLGRPINASAVSPQMALDLAKSFQQQTQADFVLAESGMAGPLEGIRQSQKHGQCEMVLITPESCSLQSHQSNPFLSKKEHQLIFAKTALQWLLEFL